jgi:K(+)-stimulated pyrophosphate-energized sodium pump
LPLIISMAGLVASMVGIVSIRVLQRYTPQAALRYSTFITAGLFLIAALIICLGMGLPECPGQWSLCERL